MRLLIAGLTMIPGGCVRHLAPSPPAAVSGPTYVELQPGWRVHVITPKLKSGGFLLQKAEQREDGNTIALRAGDEFLGYESANYRVDARKDAGVRITQATVEFNREGEITYPAQSFAPRFGLPDHHRHVRLLYMQKVSDADHAMAVLAAPDPRRLAALTLRVQSSPATCRNSRNEYCEWIPAGVAVRPERPNGAGWAPVR